MSTIEENLRLMQTLDAGWIIPLYACLHNHPVNWLENGRTAIKMRENFYFFCAGFSSWWISLHLLTHSQFSGRNLPSGPGFIVV